jgi:membrane-bound lytic murein transglycosylase MltF
MQFKAERGEVVRAFQKELERIRPELDGSRAADYARIALIATDEYPSVDPLLLLAMGTVESAHDERAVSHAGARGLYQILPSTGRRLARDMGRDFDTTVLYDPHVNTLMAARYLNELMGKHGNLRLVLAAYNGGPHNAALFRSGSAQLADETRHYVRKVMERYEQIVEDATTHQLQTSNESDRWIRMEEVRLEMSTLPPSAFESEPNRFPVDDDVGQEARGVLERQYAEIHDR